MDANCKEEDSDKAKVNYGMDQNGNTASLHVPEFNHVSMAGKLEY